MLHEAIRATLNEDRARAERLMKAIYREPRPRPRPRGPSVRSQLAVYRRDHFHCRYCDRKTIFYPVFELFGVGFFPKEMPFHPNWLADVIHPAIPVWSSSIDHVFPLSAGGQSRDPRNLVTACSRCQYRKGNARGGWLPRPLTLDGWAGLSNLYEALWNATQYSSSPLVRGRSHDRWITELRRPSADIPDALPEGLPA